jgi:NADH-quinone oxidoreductase subunit J
VSSQLIAFLILAAVAVASGILMITRRNPVNSALFLIVNFLALAGIYLTLHAQFVAVIQILVYAGAIMVLVLFVIMLLNLQDETRLIEHLRPFNYAAIALALGMLGAVIWTLNAAGSPALRALTARSPESSRIGTVEHLGVALYTTAAWPILLASMLLLAAMIGAVMIAKKRFP